MGLQGRMSAPSLDLCCNSQGTSGINSQISVGGAGVVNPMIQAKLVPGETGLFQQLYIFIPQFIFRYNV